MNKINFPYFHNTQACQVIVQIKIKHGFHGFKKQVRTAGIVFLTTIHQNFQLR